MKGNVLAAAAYHGKNEMLKYLLALPELKSYIDIVCLETQDIRPIKAGPFTQEYLGYSPLMLATVSPNADVETI